MSQPTPSLIGRKNCGENAEFLSLWVYLWKINTESLCIRLSWVPYVYHGEQCSQGHLDCLPHHPGNKWWSKDLNPHVTVRSHRHHFFVDKCYVFSVFWNTEEPQGPQVFERGQSPWPLLHGTLLLPFLILVRSIFTAGILLWGQIDQEGEMARLREVSFRAMSDLI